MLKHCPIIKLAITLLIFAFFVGCTEDIPDKITESDFPIPPSLKLVSSTVKNNMQLNPDGEITFTFNNSMDFVSINIFGVSGSTTLKSGNTSATFKPLSKIPDGTYILTINGKDEYGQEFKNDSITFYVQSTYDSYSLIAFASDREGDYEIYVMGTDGSNVTPLTNNFAQDTQPVWSPDGGYIAYSSDQDGAFMWNSDIIVMRSDGSSQINLTNTFGINESNPFWSWDGTMVGFLTDMHGNQEYYVVNVDGTNMRPMDENDFFDFLYPWMYEGIYEDSILMWNDSSGNNEIYLDNNNGIINLTNNFASDTWASWSPDGQKIVFTSDRDGNNEIYIMNANGSSPTRITNNFKDDIHPCWSPFDTSLIEIKIR
jgi:Tol biopolymer transport system component